VRILLAEDDASQAESIQTWLEMDGYVIDWVERGDHAILALEQHQYDCVLLDRGLPRASGDQILTTLRKLQKDTPVIFITARDSIDDRVEGLDLGANDYLLDIQAKTLTKAGEVVNLTAKEFQILHKLMQKPEHVVTREQLEESLYAWGDEIESNAIEVFIYQLRKKIGSQMIKTIRGLGYRMHKAEG